MRPSMSSSPHGWTTALQFGAAGLVWGSSFLFMKVALEGATFMQILWARLVLGALALAVVMLVTRSRVPRTPRLWGHFAVVAITGSVVPFGLFAWAEQYVDSGIASILNALTPIMTAVMVTLAFRVERVTREQIVGVVAGILGVIVIVGPWRFTDRIAGTGAPLSEFAGQLACVGAALCYGFTFGYLRRFITPTGVSGVTTAFLQMALAALAVILLTPVVFSTPIVLTVPVLLSLAALGVLGTGFAYLWNINVLLRWGPTATSMVTYISPVIGVLLGVTVLGETLHWHEPVGAILVLVGILFAQRRIKLSGSWLQGRRERGVSGDPAPAGKAPRRRSGR